MNIDRAINLDDIREAAKRVLPRIIYDFIESGAEDERCLAINRKARTAVHLLPSYFGEMGPVDQSVVLMGRRYASPFGIAPTAFAGLFRPGADLMLARSAAEAEIPFVLSTSANLSIEEAASAGNGYTWFQLYCARDRSISADMMRRASQAGITTLVVTVDTPVHSKRERNMRNGFSHPLRLRFPIFLEALLHPGWIVRYLRSGGTPPFVNWMPYAGNGASGNDVAAFSMTQIPNRQTWNDLKVVRDQWPHKLVVKGIMHSEDAQQAVEIGADGIIVSNHGGRVLDRAPSSFAVFPFIRAAVGSRTTLMLDSGIARGSDIVTAFCMGAQFTFVGRGTLYGAAAAGIVGVRRTIQILRQEVDTILNQIGCQAPAQLGEHYLFSSAGLSPTAGP